MSAAEDRPKVVDGPGIFAGHANARRGLGAPPVYLLERRDLVRVGGFVERCGLLARYLTVRVGENRTGVEP